MVQEILQKQVPLYQVMLLCFYALPSVIAMAAPFASLMGTLMAIGRLSSDNEILIMLSAGLSYRMVFLPALFVGVLISLFSFIANDILLPAGTIQFAKLYRKVLVSSPALELEANSVKRFKDTVIITGPVSGTAIGNIFILDKTGNGERRVIMARNAVLKDAGHEGLSLDLSDTFIQSSKEIIRDDYDYASTGLLRYWVPQEDLMQAVSSVSPREMSSTDLRHDIERRAKEQQDRLNSRQYRSLNQGLNLEEILRKGTWEDSWNRRESTFNTFSREFQSIRSIRNDRNLLNYRLEYNKKFSIPFGAMSFIFLAVSLGLMAKKNGRTVGFIIGMMISVVYWALLLGGQTMGLRMGYSPFWSMWLPNILAASIGLVLVLVRIRK